MATYRLDIGYDGTGYCGWARQPGQLSLQGELEDALSELFRDRITATPAGRTDAGVHALSQVVSFAADPAFEPDNLHRALNALTPRAMSIWSAARAPDGFDARRDALSRSYVYRIETASVPNPFELGRALRFPYEMDLGLLDRCAELIVGKHDFTAFTPTATEHRFFNRTVLRAEWGAGAGHSIIEFRVEADAFMRNMVRILVGTQLEVAVGKRSIDDFAALLEGAERSLAGDTAAPHGLYLTGVSYPP